MAIARTSPDGWFRISEVADGVIALSETLGERDRYGLGWVHSYLVLGGSRAGLVDASLGIGDLQAAVRQVTSLPIEVLLTHYHYDHIGSIGQFVAVGIAEEEADLLERPSGEMIRLAAGIPARVGDRGPAGFDPATYGVAAKRPTRLLHDGDGVDLGNRTLQVHHTPGHSPGSLTFIDPGDRLVFPGDTVCGGIVTLSLERCDPAAYAGSIRRMASFVKPDDTLLPAHYSTPLDAQILEEIQAGIDDVRDGRRALETQHDEREEWRLADLGRCGLRLPPGRMDPFPA